MDSIVAKLSSLNLKADIKPDLPNHDIAALAKVIVRNKYFLIKFQFIKQYYIKY